MTALNADRNTPRSTGDIRVLGLAASTVVYAGALIMRNAAGFAVNGKTALNLVGVGCAEESSRNDGAAGSLSIAVRIGTFRFANSAAGDAITIADIGAPAYAVDDQTVAKTNGSGTRSIAGFIEGVDPQGVWVRFDEIAARSFAALNA